MGFFSTYVRVLLLCGGASALTTPRKVGRVMKEAANLAAAAALVTAPMTAALPASAARSGGRAGGRSFRSAPMRSTPRAAPRTSVRTYAAPVAVPVPVPGYGGGFYGGGFGGFGVSPGAYLGLSLIDAIVDEQRRAAYLRQQIETQRQLGRDAGDIESLRAQLDAQEKRIAELQAKTNDK